MEIAHELEYLGFTSNEVKVYLTLLRIGKSKAGRLSKECGLERTSTYNALKRLMQEGVVSYVIESNERIFSAGEPERILDMFKEKEERVKLIMPKLKSIKNYEREKESIYKFKGIAGVKSVFNDILNSTEKGGEYLIFGSENQLSEIMPVFTEIYVAKKDKKKIRARILIKESMKQKGKKKSKYTQVRFVPKEVLSTANVNVYGDKVAIFIWSETPEAIIIDDKSTSDSFRSYFEFMWKNAKR